MTDHFLVRRRQLLKAGAAGAGVLAMGGAGALSAGPMAQRLLGAAAAASTYIEVFPTSPLILEPFRDTPDNQLPIPQAARPVGTDAQAVAAYFGKLGLAAPDPRTGGTQDANGAVHQLGPDRLTLPYPHVYHVRLEVGTHRFTPSKVLPITSAGKPSAYYRNGKAVPVGPSDAIPLPPSVITGFNAGPLGSAVGFPGPRINAKYGQPVLVRFDNHLDTNTTGLSRADFGSPELGFLTHLHNGHTAPESDGNPHYRCNQQLTQPGGITGGHYHPSGYLPGDWVDNLYLNYPAGGDDREKQALLWFHDHFHNHTGANVYKGMVGLFPVYDPGSSIGGRAFSDLGENLPGSLGLPGIYRPNGDGSFEVDYDIPLALYDVRLDDGVTVHQDFHAAAYTTPEWGSVVPGQPHPEWWGQSFFKHFPNHGFVGDIFTVNGAAFPVMHVTRRQYRFRCLDASIARIYELSFMSSSKGPVAAKDLGYQGDELQGQYRLPDGQQCLRLLQVENGGGLLPRPLLQNKIELWPAMRRGFVVDFGHYMDGRATTRGEVIYLVNTCKMPDGRMPTSPDPAYKVPLIKFIIDGDPAPEDQDHSLPIEDQATHRDLLNQPLRPQPEVLLPDGHSYPVAALFDSKGSPIPALKQMIDTGRQFTLERGGQTSLPPPNEPNDNEWSINGTAFDETRNARDHKGRETKPRQGVPEVWTVINGGGGWVHPMHMHQEEHKILLRNGKPAATWQQPVTDPRHADDIGKDDVVLLDPSEKVVFYRNFRTFRGKYVAHCHNLAHEDHSMMFGWEIQ